MILFLFLTTVWYYGVYFGTRAILDAYAAGKPDNTNWTAIGVSVIVTLMLSLPIFAYAYIYIMQ